jgi:hypothetical protein
LEAILELQNALLKDYYKEFVISINAEEIDFNQYNNHIITYRGESSFEKKFDILYNEVNYILSDTKELYYRTMSETLSKLSNLDTESKKLNYLKYNIQILNITLSRLENDFNFDSKKSRYYIESYFVDEVSIASDIMVSIFNPKNKFGKKEITEDYDFIDVVYFTERLQTLLKLPFSLHIIVSCLIKTLTNKLDIIDEAIQDKEAIKEKIEWSGKASQLGYIFSKLAELDYLSPPRREDGEPNYTQFAKKVMQIFKIKTTEGTLSKYLNLNSEKAQETHRTFEKAKFNIPHKKEVS